MNAPIQAMTDAERERRIETLGAAMVMSKDLTERASLWRRMREEIKLRSAEQVERMEAAKGLK